MITGVALASHGEVLHILPRPFRHHDLIHRFSHLYPGMMMVVQGFVDEHGTFYNRVDAGRHDYACGQIESLMSPPELYSEDLW